MIVLLLAALLMTLFAGWRAWRRVRYFLHMYQLESYKPGRYMRWLRRQAGGRVLRVSHRIALPWLAVFWWTHLQTGAFWIIPTAVLGWAVFFASSRHYQGAPQKKPISFTPRMKRLAAAALGLTALPVLTGLFFGIRSGEPGGIFFYLAGFFAADLGAPLFVYLAALIMIPFERAIQDGFKRQARQKLASLSNLKTIGITGSYGKTSVKFIVAEILKQRYQVLATPGSYNTPMGICLVVNNRLRPEHQVLVLEMGMRYRGDIRELCAMAQPDLSIVTDVGPAHLETMGSIEQIALEKGDILEYMKPDGIAVLNIDNPFVADMARRAAGKIWRVSIAGDERADIKASNIEYSPDGARFDVEDETGHAMTFTTQLLGRHNILNILLGVAVGREMGLRLRQIAHAVTRIEPVEHRLQLRLKGAITVIDDAFNANPVGAQNAVEVLGSFKTGRRIIVTPGMVELGERQWQENRQLGEHIARNVDLAVLIGEQQTAPIVEGLQAGHFPEPQTKIFTSFFDAQAFLQSYLKPGDVVLYENDLPDQYNEG